MKVQTYWCQDENGNFYVLRKSLVSSSPAGKFINNIWEAWVCVPIGINNDKCLVYYLSDFNYGRQGNKIILNAWTQDQIKLARMNVLQVFAE
jgi:hypothetical protein